MRDERTIKLLGIKGSLMKFEVTESLRGAVSIMQLLGPCGILELQLELNSVARDGYYFRLKDDGFSFELQYHNGIFELKRNDYSVTFEGKNGKCEGIYHTVVFAWSPEWLAAGANGHIKKIDTPPTSIPVSIHRQAKRENLLPNLSFSSEEQFRQKVLDCFYSIQNKVTETKCQNSFWNFTKGNNGKVTSITPKDETQIQSTIHGLLYDQMMVNSIEVIPEYQNGKGILDFCLMAQVDDIGFVKLAVEFKRAHSSKLTHGIETQLPLYMKSVQSNYGIYGVFWFKGEIFDQPLKYNSKEDLEYSLNDLRCSSNIPEHSNVNVITFDLNHGKSASNA